MNIVDTLDQVHVWKKNRNKNIKRIGKNYAGQFVIEFTGGAKIIVEADEKTSAEDFHSVFSAIRL